MRIYDIGANIGKFTDENIKINKDCEFILLEANPKLCDDLKRKYEKNNKIKIFNYLVSDVDNQDIDFHIYRSNPLSTASIDWAKTGRFKDHYNDGKIEKTIKINSICLDTLIDVYGESDYIKIDVEGYENVVIKGMKKYLGLLSFEWAEELKNQIIDSISHLNSIGYSQYYISYNDNYTFIPNNFISYDEIISSINLNLKINRMDKWGMIFAK
jgi:FkbM family methyltransferase